MIKKKKKKKSTVEVAINGKPTRKKSHFCLALAQAQLQAAKIAPCYDISI